MQPIHELINLLPYISREAKRRDAARAFDQSGKVARLGSTLRAGSCRLEHAPVQGCLPSNSGFVDSKLHSSSVAKRVSCESIQKSRFISQFFPFLSPRTEQANYPASAVSTQPRDS